MTHRSCRDHRNHPPHGGRALCVLSIAWFCGCSGGGFDIKVSRPANERPDVTEEITNAGALQIPKSKPFNLTSYTSGQTGQGTGRSTVESSGSAEASAEAKDAGTAWAEFQLGYTFDNTARTALAASIRLHLDVARKFEANGDAPDTSVKSELTFLIKDSNGATIHSEPVLTGGAGRDHHEVSGRQDIVLDSRFEPGLGYYFVLAGRVDVTSAAGKRASAHLTIKGAELTFNWRQAEHREPASRPSR